GLVVTAHHALDRVFVLGGERLEVDALRVDPAREAPVEIEHVGEATAHAGAEVPACAAEHDDAAPGHVLAAVVADALDHRLGAAVAHAEALARDALEVRLSPVAPYSTTLPVTMFSAGSKRAASGTRTTSLPPERPLPQ